MSVAKSLISKEQAQGYGWLEEPYKSAHFREKYNEHSEYLRGKPWGHPLDYPNMDFPKYLRRADLSYANMKKADLTDTDLRNSTLAGSNLKGADLTKSRLMGADLTDAVLVNAVLIDAVLIDSELTDAVLVNAVLVNAVLIDAVLIDADLTDADLTDADLTAADLTAADLRGACLTGADLTDAVLINAEVDARSILKETNKLSGVDFTNTMLFRKGEPLGLRKSRRLIIKRMVELKITDAKGLGDGYKAALKDAGLLKSKADIDTSLAGKCFKPAANIPTKNKKIGESKSTTTRDLEKDFDDLDR